MLYVILVVVCAIVGAILFSIGNSDNPFSGFATLFGMFGGCVAGLIVATIISIPVNLIFAEEIKQATVVEYQEQDVLGAFIDIANESEGSSNTYIVWNDKENNINKINLDSPSVELVESDDWKVVTKTSRVEGFWYWFAETNERVEKTIYIPISDLFANSAKPNK